MADSSKPTFISRLARLPLKLAPNVVVPVLSGSLRGKLWIVASGLHSCWLGTFERGRQESISREVHSNTVFYDIGANVGFYTLLASKLVGGGRVFAFEPAPRNRVYLQRHLHLNRASNVEIMDFAVSDTNGQSTFATERTGYAGHLSDDGDIRVSTVTLDSIVESGKTPVPDYIKMDIEGGELLALRGAAGIFQRYKPVLFLSTHGRSVHVECRSLLESWGYVVQDEDSGGFGVFGELMAKFPPR
jgi:FkbM family methyltransferase